MPGITVIAIQQRENADRQQNIALSRQLAVNAQQIAIQDIGQAMRLSLDAYAKAPTTEARSSLLSVASRPTHRLRIPLPSFTNGRIALSRDGRLLAAVTNCCGSRSTLNVVIWDIQNGARPLELAGSGSAAQEIVTTVEFSPDGKQFATGTSDGTIRLWDLPSGTLRGKIAAHVGMVGALTYSPDGSRIASLGREDHLVGLWNTTDHRQVMSWQHGGPRAGLTFSPDGRVLACSGENDNLFLWDVTTGAALPLGLHGAEAVDYSPDGKTIATVNAEGHLAIWDLVTATRRPTPEIGRRINDVAYTSDGQAVVSVDTNGAVRLTDVARGITLTEIATGESNGLHTVTTAADGTIAAAGETAALLWKPAELPYIGGEVSTDLTFGPNGRSILATGQFHTLVSWDVAKPAQPIVEIANADPNADSHQVFSPDGARLARMTPNGQVVVYDVASGTHIAELNVKAGFLQPMAFSPDGRLLAIGGGSTVVWDIGRRHP